MKVRFRMDSTSPAGVYRAGQTADLDAEQARALVHSGVAEAVVTAPETAALEPEQPNEGGPRRRRRPQKRG